MSVCAGKYENLNILYQPNDQTGLVQEIIKVQKSTHPKRIPGFMLLIFICEQWNEPLSTIHSFTRSFIPSSFRFLHDAIWVLQHAIWMSKISKGVPLFANEDQIIPKEEIRFGWTSYLLRIARLSRVLSHPPVPPPRKKTRN